MTFTAENSTQAAHLRVVGRPFEKGQSGNPGGRPKGLAARAREKTGDGATLIDFLVGVVDDQSARTADRIDACRILMERGYGRPLSVRVELGEAPDHVLLSELSPDQFDALGRARAALVAAGLGDDLAPLPPSD